MIIAIVEVVAVVVIVKESLVTELEIVRDPSSCELTAVSSSLMLSAIVTSSEGSSTAIMRTLEWSQTGMDPTVPSCVTTRAEMLVATRMRAKMTDFIPFLELGRLKNIVVGIEFLALSALAADDDFVDDALAIGASREGWIRPLLILVLIRQQWREVVTSAL